MRRIAHFLGDLSCNFCFFVKKVKIQSKHEGIQLRSGFLCVSLVTGLIQDPLRGGGWCE